MYELKEPIISREMLLFKLLLSYRESAISAQTKEPSFQKALRIIRYFRQIGKAECSNNVHRLMARSPILLPLPSLFASSSAA